MEKDMVAALETAPHEHLMTLLCEQRDLYRALRELSERQRALIAGDRPELLLNILRDRQTLVASLARLNDALAPFRRNWDERYAAFPPAVREQTSALLAEINSLLRVILKTDQEDGALLSARKQATANELNGLTGGRTANAAYARTASLVGSAVADVTG